jgi:hypothetical protein
VVIDGYHAFAALPADLSAIAGRAFYVAGGYKYAMAGEGVCFLVVPPGTEVRPLSTGWFADFEGLGSAQLGPVGYGDAGMRFFGATFDPSGLYRFNAVMRWLDEIGLDFGAVHGHVERLQQRFVDALSTNPISALPLNRLVPPAGVPRGNFLTFALPRAPEVEAALTQHHVSVDRRRDRLRWIWRNTMSICRSLWTGRAERCRASKLAERSSPLSAGKVGEGKETEQSGREALGREDTERQIEWPFSTRRTASWWSWRAGSRNLQDMGHAGDVTTAAEPWWPVWGRAAGPPPYRGSARARDSWNPAALCLIRETLGRPAFADFASPCRLEFDFRFAAPKN